MDGIDSDMLLSITVPFSGSLRQQQTAELNSRWSKTFLFHLLNFFSICYLVLLCLLISERPKEWYCNTWKLVWVYLNQSNKRYRPLTFLPPTDVSMFSVAGIKCHVIGFHFVCCDERQALKYMLSRERESFWRSKVHVFCGWEKKHNEDLWATRRFELNSFLYLIWSGLLL